MEKIHFELRPLLAACGLGNNEVTVYASLVHSGPATVAAIARLSGLHRPAVYASLPKLLSVHLVSSRASGKRTVYVPSSTDQVKTLALFHLKDVPELLAGMEVGAVLERGQVQVLTGPKGLRSVLDDLISSIERGGIFYRISSRRADTDIEQYTPTSYREERDRKKLEQFVISNKELSARPFKKRMECLSKIVGEGKEPFNYNVAQLVYGEKTAIVDYNTETAFIIKNPMIAKFYVHLFKLLFRGL